MKKTFFAIVAAIVVAFASGSYASAQNVKREGKVFTTVKSVKDTTERKSGFTYKDSKGKTYNIYVGKTGSCYIKRISKNTGKPYKSYLGVEISTQICKELKIPYTPRTTTSSK